MSRRIGRVTYERRYVIVQVPDDWTEAQPLPPACPEDEWFDSMVAFREALGAPFDHRPINRRPCRADEPGTI